MCVDVSGVRVAVSESLRMNLRLSQARDGQKPTDGKKEINVLTNISSHPVTMYEDGRDVMMEASAFIIPHRFLFTASCTRVKNIQSTRCHLSSDSWLQGISNTVYLLPQLYTLTNHFVHLLMLSSHLFRCLPLASLPSVLSWKGSRIALFLKVMEIIHLSIVYISASRSLFILSYLSHPLLLISQSSLFVAGLSRWKNHHSEQTTELVFSNTTNAGMLRHLHSLMLPF